jgi:CHAD domain-containing protein
MDPATPAADLVRAALAASVDRLVAADAQLRLDASAEAVHQARVAVRRLRSDLRTFFAVLDEHWARALRESLAWLGDGLSAARDADVLLARLERQAQTLPFAERQTSGEVLRPFRDRREAAYGRVCAMLLEERYVTLVRETVAAAHAPEFGHRAAERAGDVVPGMLQEAWRKLRRAVRRRTRPPSDRELHRIRINAKRLRYAAEAVAPVAGKGALRFAQRVARLQTILGDQRDSVNAVRGLGEQPASGEAAFVAGQLAALERLAAADANARWRAAWRALTRRRRHFWRGG